METKFTWEIFIQNSDFSMCVFSKMFGTCRWVIEFNGEFKIRLPFLVINNVNLEGLFNFSFRQGENFIEECEILWCFSSALNSSGSKLNVRVLIFLHNCDLNISTAFSYGIMEAFESNLVIFLLNLSDNIFNLTFLSLEIQEIFVSTEVVSFSCSKSLHKGLWLKLCVKFFSIA